jgi:hypothetical protein
MRFSEMNAGIPGTRFGAGKTSLRILSFAFAALIAAPPAAGQRKHRLPDGWRLAGKDDYAAEDIRFFNGSMPNHAEADFDGDGKKDHALILFEPDASKCGLFVLLGGGRSLKLEEMELSGRDDRIRAGLSPVKPGKYLTACGRGYWKCAPDETEELNLNRMGIYFFLFEGASSIFYWNDSTRMFDRAWMGR